MCVDGGLEGGSDGRINFFWWALNEKTIMIGKLMHTHTHTHTHSRIAMFVVYIR